MEDAKEFRFDGRAPVLDGELSVLRVRDQPLFPGAILRVDALDAEAIALVQSLAQQSQPILAVVPAESVRPGAIGVAGRVLKSMGYDSGNFGLVALGLERVRLERIVQQKPYLTARVARLASGGAPPSTADVERLRALAKEVVRHMPELPAEASQMLDELQDPGALIDQLAANLDPTFADSVTLLEAADVAARVPLALRWLSAKLALLEKDLSVLPGAPLRQPWPFLPGAEERMKRSVAAGSLTPDEARRLADFAAKGYVVWERLIEPKLVDELVSDIRDIRKHPGHFVTTYHKNSLPYRFSGTDFDSYESIFDLYVNLESARRVCFHPTIARFLELLFEARPVAFQQLLFQRSNGHPMHQDTAYVCVDHPLLMAASWIALEDVVPGRGELTYYEGSHRIPHGFFHDGSKRFDPRHDDEQAMRRRLVEESLALGCAKRDFIAKKGDVFLWSADLVHGSNPRTRPDAETRMSCVTHYCPETTRPFWFRTLANHRGLEKHGEQARIASSYYRLPKATAMVRPTFKLPERPVLHD